jgi:hypothetical protein
VGKYGTNLEGFGAFEGGVNADKGAPLISTSSDGETALLFGPAALREIQSGVANGDFAIPPDAAGDTITEENPLPYWTFTDTSSAGAITCSIVADATSGSGNKLRFSVAANTSAPKQAKMTRFVPIFGTQNQAFSYAVELTTKCSVTSGAMSIAIQQDFFEIDQVTTVGSSTFIGSAFSTSLVTVSTGNAPATALAVPPSAAFVRIIVYVSVQSASPGTVSTCDVFETRLLRGDQALFIAEQTAPGTYAPALIQQSSGVLTIKPATGVQINGANSLYVSRASVASAAQSLTNNTGATILLDTASTTPTTGTYDPKSWFNDPNNRIAVGQAGFYCVTANIAFAANATGRRLVSIAVNGTEVTSTSVMAAPTGSTILCATTNLYLAAGDLVTMSAIQTSGGALNTVVIAGFYPALSVGRIGA